MPIRSLVLGLLSAHLVASSLGATSATGPQTPRAAAGPDSIIEACRDGLDRKVADDGDDRGYAGRGAAVQLDADGQGSEVNKNSVKLSGTGQFKYGADYLWAPMSFTCEWDLEKQKLKKVSYKKAKGADPMALPPAKAQAVAACRGAARKEIDEEGRRRRYYSPSISMEDGSRFDESRETEVLIQGRGSYRLDSVQKDATEFAFSCAWEIERGRVADVRLERHTSWQGEMGEITCESQKMQRRTCNAPIGGRVRMTSKYSDAPCTQGSSWSYTSTAITVWDGCRGRFEFEMR